MLPVFRSNAFSAAMCGEGKPQAAYGFYGRQGGVSAAPYDALNCGVGSPDDAAHVAENRRRVVHDLLGGDGHLYGVYQVHGSQCVRVDKGLNCNDIRPEADALVTDVPGRVIGVLSADCAPVLFYGARGAQRVIGAAHAGWKGAMSGVLEETVRMMCLYDGVAPDCIYACVGPCIAQPSYEVGEEFMQEIVGQDPACAAFFTSEFTRGTLGKAHFDLPAFCCYRLKAAGVGQVYELGLDTYQQERDFFSYRRSVHRQEDSYGRQVSAITLL